GGPAAMDPERGRPRRWPRYGVHLQSARAQTLRLGGRGGRPSLAALAEPGWWAVRGDSGWPGPDTVPASRDACLGRVALGRGLREPCRRRGYRPRCGLGGCGLPLRGADRLARRRTGTG